MNNNKNSYYERITTEMVLGGKELLKSMPLLYNTVYFSSELANVLWSGDKEETFSCITLLTEESNIERLRNIIKNNFLYVGEWDSLKFTNGEDYGFSFVGGHIKYVVLSFKETEKGYSIKSYDVTTGNCNDTTIETDKKFFLDVSMKENGEVVRTCAFKLLDITKDNTKTHRAQKKAEPQLIAINDNRGFANVLAFMIIGLLCVTVVYGSYLLIRG